MNWGRLDDPAWWWEYALDGVIGGVIGGLVTALAVWLTLRHERRLASDANERAAVGADRSEGRAMALRLQATATRLAFGMSTMEPDEWWIGVGPSDPEVVKYRVALTDEVLALRWMLAKRWPATAETLWDLLGKVEEVMNKEEFPGMDPIREAVVDVAIAASRWGEDPERAEEFHKPKHEAITTPPTGGLLRRLRAPHWARVRRKGKPAPAATPTPAPPPPTDQAPKSEE